MKAMMLGVLALALLLGCARKLPPAAESKTDSGEHHDDGGGHEELPQRVTLSPQVVKAAGIQAEPVRTQQLPATVELSGEVAADPDQSVRVAARVGGLVTQVAFKEGERVAAGALLVVLQSAELAKTQADFQSVQAKAQAAQKNAERLEALAQTGLSAGQELLAAQAEASSLRAEAEAAERGLRAVGLGAGQLGQGTARLEIRAPLAGVALTRNALVGQTVALGHVFTELVNLDRAYFVGRLFEKNLARVRAGQAAEVHLNAYPGEAFVGQVESIGKQLDPVARTVVARITLANHGDLLKVGLFGKAQVSSTTVLPAGPAHLVVPLGAVTELAGRPAVFVRHPDGHFTVHAVTLGRSAGGRVEVLSGLRAGEAVVVEGAFTLKSVLLKGSFGEEE